MNNKRTVHLIGNAHLDPVWLWRFQDGLAEIKATYRSALDRIKENDEFIFTTACACYYEWVEKNCPEMFEEVKAAVKAGKWSIVGGMWIQPDCNIPCTESLVRQMLYSQRYFLEKFGIRARTAYNVDSFGHSAALPRLLNGGGIDRYVFMRPAPGDEMKYPFDDDMFNWRCGESEVTTHRVFEKYCHNLTDDEFLKTFDAAVSGYAHNTMLFYGVGNHGGGPTVTNLRVLDAFKQVSTNEFIYSTPDACFESVDASTLPTYEGELQNHASGCYSTSSSLKMLNRACESRLNEGERMSVLSSCLTGFETNAEENAKAWKAVMFNHFHDIITGCTLRAGADDAISFFGAAKSHGICLTNDALQKISWSIDTSRGTNPHSKESSRWVWESNDLGTPVVVFNPLSHSVRVPTAAYGFNCASVTDGDGNPVPFQIIRADFVHSPREKTQIYFRPEIPAMGWKVFWIYLNKDMGKAAPKGKLNADGNILSNDRLTVTFDEKTGNIRSITDAKGNIRLSGTETIVINDEQNDTWAHNKFIFEDKIDEFGSPVFRVIDNGPCRASIKITQTCRQSRLEQTYTLYPNDPAVHVESRLILNEPLVMVKHCFKTELASPKFTREIPGGTVSVPIGGRELPMQRWMLLSDGDCGVAVINNGKYSASASGNEMRMVAARSCYYADHYGISVRDDIMHMQDIGEHDYAYEIRLYDGDRTDIVRAAEELNTEFSVIPETYHKGTLPEVASNISLDCDNVTLIALKPAEDGNGFIVRLAEIGGRNADLHAKILGTTIDCTFSPEQIRTFRISDGEAAECDFCELAL